MRTQRVGQSGMVDRASVGQWLLYAAAHLSQQGYDELPAPARAKRDAADGTRHPGAVLASTPSEFFTEEQIYSSTPDSVPYMY